MSNTITINRKKYTEVPGACLGNFFTAVKKIQRPYIPISTEDYEKIMAETTSDVIMDAKDRQYTFGNADGPDRYWLMPLMEKYYFEVE